MNIKEFVDGLVEAEIDLSKAFWAKKKGFDEWKRKVNAAVEKKAGLSADDLPDVNYSDWYEQGMSPSAAASKAIKSAKE
jgi:hypothetical protein